jgi:hypothetical protein
MYHIWEREESIQREVRKLKGKDHRHRWENIKMNLTEISYGAG